ncbi:GNAT family N-acetyltransferase [Rhodospirillum centenum]|uniref:GNAT family N-acetyltransferase n=1 Tax=Rhodospirillum centenum TaxID=34018 RepID=UPI0002D6F230|nr:GNAT family protein [Rhodospirillum centenum]
MTSRLPPVPLRLFQAGFLSPPAIRLDGEAVFIRPPQARDWRDWADLREASREFLTPWEPTWPPDALSRPAFLRRVRRQAVEWREDEGYSFLVFERGTEALVGGIGLSNVRRGVAQMGTMGYWVGRPYARRGYTSEAARLVLGFAFGQLGLHRVEAACLPSNIPSQGVLEKAGFSREGYARGYLRIDGKWADHVLFGILRDDWRG